ncbi:hypothetical protein [Fodinibius salsisoli]|uniref:Uncharacterized protein n=1 Tax=Fodinibius salsisoli TaxID=2820877 RepID=A0ABT3PK70_9BACT|nr:hypothetical protein [Fodinibius salsisoli]MCW9706302.1 hypothetical protein [Fodinibius salsisoli]
MLWVDGLLTLVGGYAAFELIKFARGRGRLKFLGLTIAACLFTFMQSTVFIGNLFETPAVLTVVEFIVEWGHLICLAFILSSLAVFIRQSKPVFAQFPMVYTALPFFIIISYFFVLNSTVLREWLFFLYQAGALLVALMMYGIYTYRVKKYTTILAGVILFLICYILYWTIGAFSSSLFWIWQLILSAAIVTTVIGYKLAHKY